MDTFKIIEELEHKINDEKAKIKKNKLMILILLIISGVFLIPFIVFLILFINNNDKMNLIISVIFLSISLLSISGAMLFYYSYKANLKSLHMMEEALKSWHHRKPKVSEPLRVK